MYTAFVNTDMCCFLCISGGDQSHNNVSHRLIFKCELKDERRAPE